MHFLSYTCHNWNLISTLVKKITFYNDGDYMNTVFSKSMRIAALVAVTFASSHALAAEKIIKIDGSSTVYPITEAMAEEFQ